ncbi:class I adenylate-forming enzyme family protein [Fangia hongkongensis]|uniref:class I adenylate-forming enzyme family protein n=1 Tax=Fangia hongkongensis TaxID=270495 RepID=UPI00036338A0|nr:class I adenylate-forming enzyme family protein [Fangia hongkongensis]MBK2124779.1 acyl--CoA ligase [Fangia hongkongensis]
MLNEKINDIDALFCHLNTYGDNRHLIFQNKQYTFKQLLQYSECICQWIEKNAFQHIMFSLKNSPLNIALYLGAWKAGVHLTPINPRLIDHELIEILKRSPPCALVLEHSQQSEKLDQLCHLLDTQFFSITDPLEFLNTLPYSKSTSKLAIKAPESVITYHISSGTGGIYKLHGHALTQIFDYMYKRQFDLGLTAQDTLLISLSINHAYAFSYQLLPALALGLNMVILPEFSLKEVIDNIQAHHISALALLPTMYYFLFNEIERLSIDNTLNLSSLRFLSVAGDQTHQSLMIKSKQLLGLSLSNGIGMTELYGYSQNTTLPSAYNAVKVFDDVNVKIEPIKNHTETEQSHKKTGEVWIQSPMQPVNDKRQWLPTGDFGFIDSDHNLYFLGRIKDIIIKGGSNIAPIEIEHYLYQMPEIREVYVLGKKDKIWGEIVCACISATKHISKEELNQHLSQFISAYKMIDEIVLFDTLPKNVTGKIDRYRLREHIHGNLILG